MIPMGEMQRCCYLPQGLSSQSLQLNPASVKLARDTLGQEAGRLS